MSFASSSLGARPVFIHWSNYAAMPVLAGSRVHEMITKPVGIAEIPETPKPHRTYKVY